MDVGTLLTVVASIQQKLPAIGRLLEASPENRRSDKNLRIVSSEGVETARPTAEDITSPALAINKSKRGVKNGRWHLRIPIYHSRDYVRHNNNIRSSDHYKARPKLSHFSVYKIF